MAKLPTPPPIGSAILLCGQAEIKKGRDGDAVNLLGVTNRFCGNTEPVTPQFCAFVRLGSIRKDLHWHFEITDADGNSIGKTYAGISTCEGPPTHEVSIIQSFEDVSFPRFGEYFVRFLAENQSILETRISVEPTRAS